MFRRANKIKLAFVLPRLRNTWAFGGMETMAASLLNNLNTDKFELSLICLSKDNAIIKQIDQSRVSVHIVEQRPGLDPLLVFRLAAFFARTRPTLLHTYNEGALLYVLPAAKLAMVPAVVHAEHGRIKHEKALLTKVRILVTQLCDYVITVSDTLTNKLVQEEGVSKEKVHTVINGVDPLRFDKKEVRRDYRRELGLTDQDWAVGTIGSLTEWKNQQLLIHAAAKTRNVKVFIAGNGPKKEELEALIAELDVSSRVTLLGQRSDIPEFLNAMDLFTLTSITEGAPIALLEAMAARLPTLVTDVGGNGDIIVDNETGFLVPSNDLEAYCERLSWFEKNRLSSREMGENGRRRVEEKYSISSMVDTYDRLFHQVLSNQNAKHQKAY
ncbi:MAG: glycosyltransferase [Deltaproteobacteria bacterium]|nr:glycosyltransferase [Deltaproteobacteria bacterium]